MRKLFAIPVAVALLLHPALTGPQTSQPSDDPQVNNACELLLQMKPAQAESALRNAASPLAKALRATLLMDAPWKRELGQTTFDNDLAQKLAAETLLSYRTRKINSR